MIKILFICHGNICRSPMAEFIMKKIVEEAHCESQYQIASAATSSEEIWGGKGNPVYPPAREKLAEHGISCEGKRAVQMTREDYSRYDFLIGMDDANLRNMQRIAGGDPMQKMYKLLDFTNRPGNVSDPWYTGDFETTWKDVSKGCQAFFQWLCTKQKNH